MNLLTDIFKDELLPTLNGVLKASDPAFKPVQFDAGHYAELTARIDKKKQGFNPIIYPLIWLVMDYRQRYSVASIYEYEVDRAQLFIVEKSDGTMSSLERFEKVFKPVLIPIVSELKNIIEASGSIVNPLLEPTITLHPYATGLGDKRANLFNDTVDAIEVSELSLQVAYKPIC